MKPRSRILALALGGVLMSGFAPPGQAQKRRRLSFDQLLKEGRSFSLLGDYSRSELRLKKAQELHERAKGRMAPLALEILANRLRDALGAQDTTLAKELGTELGFRLQHFPGTRSDRTPGVLATVRWQIRQGQFTEAEEFMLRIDGADTDPDLSVESKVSYCFYRASLAIHSLGPQAALEWIDKGMELHHGLIKNFVKNRRLAGDIEILSLYQSFSLVFEDRAMRSQAAEILPRIKDLVREVQTSFGANHVAALPLKAAESLYLDRTGERSQAHLIRLELDQSLGEVADENLRRGLRLSTLEAHLRLCEDYYELGDYAACLGKLDQYGDPTGLNLTSLPHLWAPFQLLRVRIFTLLGEFEVANQALEEAREAFHKIRDPAELSLEKKLKAKELARISDGTVDRGINLAQLRSVQALLESSRGELKSAVKRLRGGIQVLENLLASPRYQDPRLIAELKVQRERLLWDQTRGKKKAQPPGPTSEYLRGLAELRKAHSEDSFQRRSLQRADLSLSHLAMAWKDPKKARGAFDRTHPFLPEEVEEAKNPRHGRFLLRLEGARTHAYLGRTQEAQAILRDAEKALDLNQFAKEHLYRAYLFREQGWVEFLAGNYARAKIFFGRAYLTFAALQVVDVPTLEKVVEVFEALEDKKNVKKFARVLRKSRQR